MRIELLRTKKLIVAFHFQSSNQAGWGCDECRKNGLESKRRCGWLAEERRGAARVVWTRGNVRLDTCPKSYITPESKGLVEAFGVWRVLGGGDPRALPARTVDAFCVLENELRAEMSDGTR